MARTFWRQVAAGKLLMMGLQLCAGPQGASVESDGSALPFPAPCWPGVAPKQQRQGKGVILLLPAPRAPGPQGALV